MFEKFIVKTDGLNENLVPSSKRDPWCQSPFQLKGVSWHEACVFVDSIIAPESLFVCGFWLCAYCQMSLKCGMAFGTQNPLVTLTLASALLHMVEKMFRGAALAPASTSRYWERCKRSELLSTGFKLRSAWFDSLSNRAESEFKFEVCVLNEPNLNSNFKSVY